jgi:SAM-dependent methyltransferase
MIDLLRDSRLKGLEIGTPPWFAAQRRMIDAKPLIRRCYDLWYSLLLRDADSVPGDHDRLPIVELGSGCSFIRELREDIITSDVTTGNVDIALDGRALPFRANSVRALLLTHVFHHIPDVKRFLQEAQRVLAPGGVVSIVDCTHTAFARFFFSVFHPEPYNAKAREWEFRPGHTMLDSNQALTWIVFFRDREQFRQTTTDLVLEQWRYLPWFSYLLSGGVNLPSLVPRPLAGAAGALDTVFRPIDPLFAIHWHLTVRKRA